MRETVKPIFENTTMEKFISVGKELVYHIKPNYDYVLHHKEHDFYDNETKTITYGFTKASVSVPIGYDFENNPLNIFAILESEAENYQPTDTTEEQATEEDYQKALAEMGVVFND